MLRSFVAILSLAALALAAPHCHSRHHHKAHTVTHTTTVTVSRAPAPTRTESSVFSTVTSVAPISSKAPSSHTETSITSTETHTITISSKAPPPHSQTSSATPSSKAQPTHTDTSTVAPAPSSKAPTHTSTVSAPAPTGDAAAYLAAHNPLRAAHGAAPLTWNQTLADAAAAWASKCVFKHSGGTLGPYGENLAAGTSETPAQAVASWASEESSYDASNPQPSHYTQMVWKGSHQLGCAYVTCAAGAIFAAEYGPTPFHVCEYFPQGNVIGEFAANVQ